MVMEQNDSRCYDTKGHSVSQCHSLQSVNKRIIYYSMMNCFNPFGQSQTVPGGGYTIPDKRLDTTYVRTEHEMNQVYTSPFSPTRQSD